MERSTNNFLAIVTAWVAAAWSLCMAAPLLAQSDVVHLATGNDGRGRTILRGEILDYNGRELTLQQANGRQKLLPANRVIRIETQHTKEETAADEAFAQGRYDQAAALYELARNTDKRTWARRRIVAQTVWSLKSLGQEAAAGEQFLILTKSDADTPFFDCIPLAWLPGVSGVELEQKARRWIEQDSQPVAMLLGASHLLLSSQGAAAANRLQHLSDHEDPRIAMLARAQLWRRQIASTNNKQLADWRNLLDRLPESLAAGPTYLLGRALIQQQQFEDGALELLRLPILYPRERPLGARALLEAGRALERLDQMPEAARLYREAVANYPGDASAGEARDLLQAMPGGKRE
ncbi:MAG: tol-pal system YbgF family protein [Pirellulales bacterium]